HYLPSFPTRRPSDLDPRDYSGNFCPANTAYMPVPPLCRDDIVMMAQLGFNSVRLPLSWSLLEPQRGQFSELYLERINQVVGWAQDRKSTRLNSSHQI